MLFGRLSDRLYRVERLLLGQANIVGVGCGWKQTRGEITAAPAWRIYVRHKLPWSVIPRSEVIPQTLEGFATDVIPIDTASAMLSTSPGQLASGVTISNLRKVAKLTLSGEQPSGLGTLGFLALVNGKREREMVLVSNRHVLLAHGAGSGDAIYAPQITHRGGQTLIHPDSLDPVAEISNEGAESNYSYQFRGEAPSEYFVDCASARILRRNDSDIRRAFSVDPGTVWPTRLCRAHPLDVVGRRTLRVRKVGGATGLTVGTLVDVSAPVDAAGGQRRLRNLVIQGKSGVFVTAGDSGALVLNDRDEAIGMIWGRSDRDPSVAYACHIHPVLDRLNVTMLPAGVPS
jgi:hypothetical protein